MVSGEKRDYLLIQIEELGRVLGKIVSRIIGLKSSGNISGIYVSVSENIQNEIELDLDFIINSSDEDIMGILTKKMAEHANLYCLLANILFELAEIEQNSEKQQNLFKKSYLLFRMSIDASKTFSVDLHSKINRIKKLINQ